MNLEERQRFEAIQKDVEDVLQTNDGSIERNTNKSLPQKVYSFEEKIIPIHSEEVNCELDSETERIISLTKRCNENGVQTQDNSKTKDKRTDITTTQLIETKDNSEQQNEENNAKKLKGGCCFIIKVVPNENQSDLGSQQVISSVPKNRENDNTSDMTLGKALESTKSQTSVQDSKNSEPKRRNNTRCDICLENGERVLTTLRCADCHRLVCTRNHLVRYCTQCIGRLKRRRRKERKVV